MTNMEHNEPLKGKIFSEVTIDEEVNIPTELVEKIQRVYATGLLQEIVDEMPREVGERVVLSDGSIVAESRVNRAMNIIRNEILQIILNKAKREGLVVKEK